MSSGSPKTSFVHRIALGLTISASACSLLSAQDIFIVGPRSTGMGGTGVASADDQSAQYANPALLGFFGLRDANGDRWTVDNNDLGRKDWGIGILDVSLGAQVHGNLLDIADELAELPTSSLGTNGIQSASDVAAAISLAKLLSSVDGGGNAVTFEGNAGSSVRIGHFMLGARAFSQATALVRNVDLLNVAFQAGGVALQNQINASGASLDGTIGAFSNAQRDALYAQLGGAGAYNPASPAGQAVQRLDYEIRQQGLNQSQIDTAFDLLQNAAASTGSTTLADNTTVIRLGGFALAEIPISYGWSIDEHLSIGASLKLLVGRVYGTEISVFEEDAYLRLNDASENFEQTLNIGVDVGVAWRTRLLQLGICGRNLNAPTFDGFTDANGVHIGDVRVDPQVAVGIACIPWYWMTIAADADVIPAETTFPGYYTQRIGIGLELTPWRILALRGGVYQNIAESDIGPVGTLGVGINLWAIRIDVAGAASLDMTEISGYRVPDEFHLSLGVSTDF